jgi:hypothetical protein
MLPVPNHCDADTEVMDLIGSKPELSSRVRCNSLSRLPSSKFGGFKSPMKLMTGFNITNLGTRR